MKKFCVFVLLLVVGTMGSYAIDDYVFDLTAMDVYVDDENGGSWDPTTGILITPSYGISRFHFSSPVDLWDYNYLVVELGSATVASQFTAFRLYDTDYTWGDTGTYLECAAHEGAGMYMLSLDEVAADGTSAFDVSSIYYLAFYSAGEESHELQITKVYATTSQHPDMHLDLTEMEINGSGAEGCSWDPETGVLITTNGGSVGKNYTNGLDLSAYKYLVVELGALTVASSSSHIRVFDANSRWGGTETYINVDITAGAGTYVIDLHGSHADGTTAFDPSSVYFILFMTEGDESHEVQVLDIYASTSCPDYDVDLTTMEVNGSGVEGCSWDPETGILITTNGGSVGRQFSSGLDLSAYKYLVVELGALTVASSSSHIRVFDANSRWGGTETYINVDITAGAGTYVIDLHGLCADGTTAFTASSVYFILFSTGGDESHEVQVNKIYATNTYPEATISLTIDPNLTGENGSWDADNRILITSAYGYGGVHFTSPIDLSAYDYLVVQLGSESKSSGFTSLKVINANSIWASENNYTTLDMHDGAGTYYLNLRGLCADGTTAFDASTIYYIAITTAGESSRQVQIDSIYATNNVLPLPMGSEGYLTCYTSRDFTMPRGLTGSVITGVDEEGNAIIEECYPSRSVVPAGTALLLAGDERTYYADITGDNIVPTATQAPASSLLFGSDERCTTYVPGDSSGDYLYYMLSTDEEGVAGFYWGAEEGAAFTSAAHKAWLALPADVAKNVKRIPLFGNGNTETGIEETTVKSATTTVEGIYTLQGVRVNSMSQRGIYIVNGKKVIVR